MISYVNCINDKFKAFVCFDNCPGCLASDCGGTLASNWDYMPDWMTFRECDTLLLVL